MPEAKLVHIVDDEDEVCRSTAFLIRMAGLDYRCWGSGGAFLSSPEIMIPGCVILDVRMPDMGGLEVQQELIDQRSPLRVIMVSGHGDNAVAQKAVECGAFAFLEKPYDQNRLLSEVRQALLSVDALL